MKDSIPHDAYERFIRLFVAQEGRLRAFLRTLVPSLDELDEVMQETSLVAWRKFAQFEPGTDFLAWVATIGRFEALRRQDGISVPFHGPQGARGRYANTDVVGLQQTAQDRRRGLGCGSDLP